MPCNSVATARAQVSSETLAKLLTPEIVRRVVATYLFQKKGKNMAAAANIARTEFAYVNGTLECRISSFADDLPEITKRLNAVAAELLALKIQAYLQAQGGEIVTSERMGTATVMHARIKS